VDDKIKLRVPVLECSQNAVVHCFCICFLFCLVFGGGATQIERECGSREREKKRNHLTGRERWEKAGSDD